MASSRFPIRFTGANRYMALLGIRPASSSVVVDDDGRARAPGLGLLASLPSRSVRHVAEDHNRVMGWGAHGWRGRWLVNGSSSGSCASGSTPARGPCPRHPDQGPVVRVSVEDPAALVAASDSSPS